MIGQLRERIRFEQPVLTADDSGGGALSWVAVDASASVWARVEATTGDEVVSADQREARVTYRITIRYRADLQPEWRVVWRGLALDLIAILPGERRAYSQLLAVAGGAQ